MSAFEPTPNIWTVDNSATFRIEANLVGEARNNAFFSDQNALH